MRRRKNNCLINLSPIISSMVASSASLRSPSRSSFSSAIGNDLHRQSSPRACTRREKCLHTLNAHLRREAPGTTVWLGEAATATRAEITLRPEGQVLKPEAAINRSLDSAMSRAGSLLRWSRTSVLTVAWGQVGSQCVQSRLTYVHAVCSSVNGLVLEHFITPPVHSSKSFTKAIPRHSVSTTEAKNPSTIEDIPACCHACLQKSERNTRRSAGLIGFSLHRQP